MRIAVASADGVALSQHFGRSRCFIVFEIADGKVIGQEVRDNTHTAHAKGNCEPGGHHHDHPHSHEGIVAALRDCQAVLCAGMGWRAAEDLKADGIEPLVMDPQKMPEEGVRDYLDGRITASSGFCRCHE